MKRGAKKGTCSVTRDSEERIWNSAAPDFCAEAVFDNRRKTIKLANYKRKYLVLIFYPTDFSYVCPTELVAFSQRIDDFKRVNCELLACSTDSVESHINWICTEPEAGGLGAINFPLLSDKNHQISKAYGVLNEKEGVAHRALFIIDNKGKIRQITVNSMEVGRSVDHILHLVQSYQHNDTTGNVCPMNWRPGEPGFKPDSKRKLSPNGNTPQSKRKRT